VPDTLNPEAVAVPDEVKPAALIVPVVVMLPLTVSGPPEKSKAAGTAIYERAAGLNV